MEKFVDEIRKHYEVEGLDERIMSAVASTGRARDAVGIDDLATVDEFHLRGREATDELAARLSLAPDSRVLDVGSGMGGTARALASRHGCHVTGIDLTESFCEAARALSARLGLADKTTFVCGDATALPFETESFDVVWTEHAQMNIGDKRAFYEGIARVLRVGGHFASHDIFAGPAGAPAFPVPWAPHAGLSFLADPTSIESLLTSLGLRAIHAADVTERATTWVRTMFARVKEHGPPAVGLHLVMGESSSAKMQNLLAALEGGQVVARMGVYEKTA